MKKDILSYIKENRLEERISASNFFKRAASPSNGNDGISTNINNAKLIEDQSNSLQATYKLG